MLETKSRIKNSRIKESRIKESRIEKLRIYKWTDWDILQVLRHEISPALYQESMLVLPNLVLLMRLKWLRVINGQSVTNIKLNCGKIGLIWPVRTTTRPPLRSTGITEMRPTQALQKLDLATKEDLGRSLRAYDYSRLYVPESVHNSGTFSSCSPSRLEVLVADLYRQDSRHHEPLPCIRHK
jgi:hypothetical protein